jgi:hypothetical protein
LEEKALVILRERRTEPDDTQSFGATEGSSLGRCEAGIRGRRPASR